jgi:hypothetical protein
MPNYNEGKIYTIRFRTDDNLIYIGSTTQPLFKRFYSHKWDSCSLRYYINENNLNWDDCYIELYEEYICENKEQLHKREGEITRQFKTDNYNVINKIIAGRTYDEWKEVNKEKIKEYKKKYDEDNKEKNKIYYENNKEKIKERTKQNKSREAIKCECGSELYKYNFSRHKKTKKHIDYIGTLK